MIAAEMVNFFGSRELPINGIVPDISALTVLFLMKILSF